MTSEERREARYLRRKDERQRRRDARVSSFDEVFTFDNLYESAQRCCRGVSWKASTQRFKANRLLAVEKLYEELRAGNFRSRGFYEFDIVERGKPRHIKSVHITERVVQRCLCDHALIPALAPSLIYDNGANIKGKGIAFAERRFACHLRRHYQKYGTKGYILQFDFSAYFESIPHAPLKAVIAKYLSDERLRALTFSLIDDFGDCGLGLGSQISQICAVAFPSAIDHFFKDKMRASGYGRYVDDGYAIHPSKSFLQKCLRHLRRLCGELGLRLNEKKTQIVRLTRGVTFLKKRYFFTGTGRLIRTIARASVVRMRRKLKTFRVWVRAGKMTPFDAFASFQSWASGLMHANAYTSLNAMRRLFDGLFAGA